MLNHEIKGATNKVNFGDITDDGGNHNLIVCRHLVNFGDIIDNQGWIIVTIGDSVSFTVVGWSLRSLHSHSLSLATGLPAPSSISKPEFIPLTQCYKYLRTAIYSYPRLIHFQNPSDWF